MAGAILSDSFRYDRNTEKERRKQPNTDVLKKKKTCIGSKRLVIKAK
jgi:hypothetical protein